MPDTLYRRALTAVIARAVSEGTGVDELIDGLVQEIANITIGSTAGRVERDQRVEITRHRLDQKVVDLEHQLRTQR